MGKLGELLRTVLAPTNPRGKGVWIIDSARFELLRKCLEALASA